MNASVIVPTQDRPEKLEKCLGAIRASSPVEIVVVDDGSVERDLVGEIAGRAGAELVRLEGRGPAAARNAGMQAARGEVVCFTDDDCEATSGWVEALVAQILGGEVECAAGRTVVAGDASAADRAWQAIADHLQRTAAGPGSPSPGFAPTCNLACSRTLLEKVPFDESFPAAAGEDRDWAARAAAKGTAPRFIPNAVVTHRPDLTTSSFLRQQYRYGKGASRFRAAAANRGLGSFSFYTGLLRASFAAGPAPGTLTCAAQLAIAAGALAERGGIGVRDGVPLRRNL
jgi:glycosyltransferase involved in cell wall biosynthesis